MENSHVLIIDDDKNIAGYFSALLGLMGYEVDVAATAKDALARLAATVPDIILLDMRLGVEIGGEDILYQVRSNPRFDHTRVIVITAYPNMVDMVKNLADIILIKPVSVDLFQTLISRVATSDSVPRHLQFRDPMTQMFNMEFFSTRLELAYERARRKSDFLFALITLKIEVSGFVEADLSPELTLAILRELSERLKRSLRPTDTIARMYGWKFVILAEDLKQKEDILIIEDRLRRVLAEPVIVGSETYHPVLFFGAALNDHPYARPEDMVIQADRLLEQSRESAHT